MPFNASTTPCHGSAPKAGSQAYGFAPTASSVGERRTSRRSGNKGDTVDFLERGLAVLHRIESGLAQRAGARALRGFLQMAHRRARRDQLAQLVVQDHELGERFSSLVAGAAAVAAAAADAEVPARDCLCLEARLREQLGIGRMRF